MTSSPSQSFPETVFAVSPAPVEPPSNSEDVSCPSGHETIPHDNDATVGESEQNLLNSAPPPIANSDRRETVEPADTPESALTVPKTTPAPYADAVHASKTATQPGIADGKSVELPASLAATTNLHTRTLSLGDETKLGTGASVGLAPAGNEMPSKSPLVADEHARKSTAEATRAVRSQPKRYRGLQRRPTVARTRNRSNAVTPLSEVENLTTLRVRVQLTFARNGGLKTVRIVPYRSAETPTELEVIDSDTQDALLLTRLRDDCYTPVALGEVADALQKGVRWLERSETPRWCWVLGGRELYVFGPGDSFGFSGFISTEALWLNERHAVMARTGIRDKVSAALIEAGCGKFAILDETSCGVPAGWIVFSEVTPSCPVPRRADNPIFNALCPLPNIKPQFVGGIRLERNVFLAGFPPRIRFTGDVKDGFPVLIDGQPAQPASDGAFEVPKWDAEGEHRLWFGDRSETYSLRTMEEGWGSWLAHDFGTGAAICGASTHRIDGARWRQVRIPATNPLLVGARPGEIFFCQVRQDVRFDTILALVPFSPVWALPSDPAHADRHSARLVLLDSQEPVPAITHANWNRRAGDAVRQWIAAVNDAGRKRLALKAENDEAKSLWQRYRIAAKQLRRKIR